MTTSMAAADSLMWKLERDPTLRSTVVAVAVLEAPPAWDALVARVERAVAAIPRLRQRVHEGRAPLPSAWEDDPGFDLTYHLRHAGAPPPGDLESVLAMAETWAAAGFDPTRPLWELTLVEGLAGGSAVLVLKLHHALTDGVGGMRLALHLFDLEPDAAPETVDVAASADPPGSRLDVSPAALGRAVRAAGSATKLLAPTGPPLSPLTTARGRHWHYARLERPLAGLRAAAHAGGGTINDAFIASVSGGLRRYHEAHGVPVQELRALVPISVRRTTDPADGNQFVPVRFAVPVSNADPLDRIAAIGRLTRAWRAEPALGISQQVAVLLDRLPAPLAASGFGLILRGIDFVATNVAGFPVPVYLAGQRVTGFYGFAPAMRAAVNVALLSHEATACIGATIDVRAIPDTALFMTCLAAGFDEVIDVIPAEARPDREVVSI
jgi:WS/DGAT/MGAT family acyltransferase